MKTIQFMIAVLFMATAIQAVPASQKPVVRVTLVDSLKIDAESGLVVDSNLMMVKAQCTACHSSKLILQHRFTRAGWQERIRWMQKYHKLWPWVILKKSCWIISKSTMDH